MESHLNKLPTDVTKVIGTMLNNKVYLVYFSYPKADDPASGYEHLENILLGVFNNLNDAVRLLLQFLYTGKEGRERNTFVNNEWIYSYSQEHRGVPLIDHDKLYIREIFMNCEIPEESNSYYYQIVGNKLIKTKNEQYCYVLSDKRNFTLSSWEMSGMNPSPSLVNAEEINVDIPEFTTFEFAKKDYNKYNDRLSNWLKIVRGI